jgi:hypothetical protein
MWCVFIVVKCPSIHGLSARTPLLPVFAFVSTMASTRFVLDGVYTKADAKLAHRLNKEQVAEALESHGGWHIDVGYQHDRVDEAGHRSWIGVRGMYEIVKPHLRSVSLVMIDSTAIPHTATGAWWQPAWKADANSSWNMSKALGVPCMVLGGVGYLRKGGFLGALKEHLASPQHWQDEPYLPVADALRPGSRVAVLSAGNDFFGGWQCVGDTWVYAPPPTADQVRRAIADFAAYLNETYDVELVPLSIVDAEDINSDL